MASIVTKPNVSSFLVESETVLGSVVTGKKLLFVANKEIMRNGFQSPDSLREVEWVPFV